MKGDEKLQKYISASTKLVHSKGKSGFTSHHQHACVCACLCLGKPGLPLSNELVDGKGRPEKWSTLSTVAMHHKGDQLKAG